MGVEGTIIPYSSVSNANIRDVPGQGHFYRRERRASQRRPGIICMLLLIYEKLPESCPAKNFLISSIILEKRLDNKARLLYSIFYSVKRLVISVVVQIVRRY